MLRSTETTSASHQSGVDSDDMSAASTMILAMSWYAAVHSAASSSSHSYPRKWLSVAHSEAPTAL